MCINLFYNKNVTMCSVFTLTPYPYSPNTLTVSFQYRISPDLSSAEITGYADSHCHLRAASVQNPF